MSYLTRPTAKRRVGSLELLYLLFVLAAGVATAWWAGHQIGVDLSSVTALASIFGITETGRLTHGAVGYSTNPPATEAAPYCSPGQAASFVLGLRGLKERLGATMGTPLECEHPTSIGGDTIQQTSTGLASYTSATNTVSFTDGWRHWAMTPSGFARWEGPQPNPSPLAS